MSASARPTELRAPRRSSARRSRAAAVLLFVALSIGVAGAQAPSSASEASGVPGTTTVDTVPAVAAFGVQVGFPAYRTATVSASLQARFAGVAVRVGGGAGGFSAGLQARVYPPLPIPVPAFVAAGLDLYAGRIAPYGAVGFHLPVAERWRLDVEGGVAWVPLLDDVVVTPYLGVGASYAFAVELTPAAPTAPEATSGGGAAGPRCVAGPPVADALDAAVAATVRRFVADAVASYGSLYRDLSYRTNVREVEVDGERATTVVAYQGAVVEILTGRQVTAAGDAEVDFRWDGCRWIRTGLRY